MLVCFIQSLALSCSIAHFVRLLCRSSLLRFVASHCLRFFFRARLPLRFVFVFSVWCLADRNALLVVSLAMFVLPFVLQFVLLSSCRNVVFLPRVIESLRPSLFGPSLRVLSCG